MRTQSGEGEEIILVRAIQTCSAAPCQWDCWDIHGRYWYLRFRSGVGTIARTYDTDEVASSFQDSGLPDITLEDMCMFLGVTWSPGAAIPGTIWEVPPDVHGTHASSAQSHEGNP